MRLSFNATFICDECNSKLTITNLNVYEGFKCSKCGKKLSDIELFNQGIHNLSEFIRQSQCNNLKIEFN